MPDTRNHATALVGEIMRAVAFLSRLPVSARYFDNAPDNGIREETRAFPLAGVLIAAAPALLLVFLESLGMTAFMAAAYATLSLVAVTGALHEDGLADVADGFAGGHAKSERLEIMKDSRIGTYGAIAIAGSLLLRVAGLAAITAAHGAFFAGLSMIAIAACSRAAMVWFWASLPNARGSGVAHDAGAPGERAVSTAAVLGLVIFAVLATITTGIVNAAAALLLALVALQGFSRLCKRLIGGHTGDTLGACQQIVEIALLTGLALGVSIPT